MMPIESNNAAPAGRPEYLFTSLFLFFGLVFALGMPPVQTPDEPSHFHRAYMVSEGRLGTDMVDGWGGGSIPRSVLHVAECFRFLIFHPELHTDRKPFVEMWTTSLQPQRRERVPCPGSAYYSFVPYVPQALAIALARAAGGGPLALMYAGRLANLALSAFLIFWAIRLMPFFKLVLGSIALLPLTVQQCASQNPDASTIGVAFLLAALMLRWSAGVPPLGGSEPPKGGTPTLAALVGLTAWLTLCKFPYAALALLYFAIPARCLGGLRRYLLVGGCLGLLVFALTARMTQLRKNTPDRITDASHGASIERQTRYICSHPLRYGRVVVNTTLEHGKIWIDQLSILGWLDTPVNSLATHPYLLFMAIVGLGDRAGPEPSWRLKGVGLAAAILCAVVILTSIYVAGNPIGAPLIHGPQGRYFIPLLLLGMLCLHNRVVRIQIEPRLLLAITAAGGASIQLISVATFVRRYYFPVEKDPLFVSVAMAAAVVLCVAVLLMGTLDWQRMQLPISYRNATDLTQSAQTLE